MSNKRSLSNDEIVTYLSTLSESESEGDPISEDEEYEYIPNQESSSESDDYHDDSGNENEQLQSTVAFSNTEDTLDVQTTSTTILTGKDGTRWEKVWDRFIKNSISCYRPSENITVDEQLFPTKCRCPFTQYIASKPDKFGIKFWLAADAKSKYLLNGFPYLGKDESRPSNQPLSEYVVLKLTEPYTGKGRNVTTDNFFTSVKLAEKLLAKNTSLVGTVNRIRREIPISIRNTRDKQYSSQILKHNQCTLTVYQCKKNKNVLLLSTVHKKVEIGNDAKRTPDTISYYNNSKFGVDVVDQMARLYTTKAASRRWPVQVFYNILDFSGINAWIIYKEVTGELISRRDFILRLAEELQKTFKNIHAEGNSESDADTYADANVSNTSNKRKQCQIRQCRGNKTTEICSHPVFRELRDEI
ncbi:piggyBac transposable element-derived protein 4-like [Palaemon carinicauda]|uniref:piggyBac transposable element-derived protein 4-like n=1 Tax=Palaemon carinicauda TaxID=392227 RepID=UPI0035B67953